MQDLFTLCEGGGSGVYAVAQVDAPQASGSGDVLAKRKQELVDSAGDLSEILANGWYATMTVRLQG